MAAATNAGHVNINSDLGESFGPWVMGNDAEVLKIVKSANVACGFHASDPTVMMDTVKLCAENGVSIGAHPGFADLQGFGRRAINLTTKELEANIAYQLGALQAIAALHGAKVTHIKPHGMMGNMSAESAEMSEAIARATKAVDRDLIFLAQANTDATTSRRPAPPSRGSPRRSAGPAPCGRLRETWSTAMASVCARAFLTARPERRRCRTRPSRRNTRRRPQRERARRVA